MKCRCEHPPPRRGGAGSCVSSKRNGRPGGRSGKEHRESNGARANESRGDGTGGVLAPGPGFEPGYSDPESEGLPLADPGVTSSGTRGGEGIRALDGDHRESLGRRIDPVAALIEEIDGPVVPYGKSFKVAVDEVLLDPLFVTERIEVGFFPCRSVDHFEHGKPISVISIPLTLAKARIS